MSSRPIEEARQGLDVRFSAHGYPPEYWVWGMPADLARPGLIRFDEGGRPQCARGLCATVSRRLDGSLNVHLPDARRLIARDANFRAAIDRILSGGPCPDFAMPRPTKRRAPGA